MQGRGVRNRLPLVITVAGLAVVLVAGFTAPAYTPFWFDPDEGCALYGRCVTPESEAMLGLLSWVQVIGFVAILAGFALRWRTPLPIPPHQPRRPLPAPVHAVVAGVAGMGSAAVTGFVALVALLTSMHTGWAALCVCWLLQSWFLTALYRTVSPAQRSARAARLSGVAASTLAIVAAAGPSIVTGVRLEPAELYAIIAGAVIAVVTYLSRVLPRRERR